MLLSKKTFPSNFYVNFPVMNSTAKMNSNPFVLLFFPIWQFQKKFKQKYIIQVSLPWNESAAALLHLHSAFLCHTERTNIRFLFSNPSKATAKKVISLEFFCRSSRGLVGGKKSFFPFCVPGNLWCLLRREFVSELLGKEFLGLWPAKNRILSSVLLFY